jgi:hypothetical protein
MIKGEPKKSEKFVFLRKKSKKIVKTVDFFKI